MRLETGSWEWSLLFFTLFAFCGNTAIAEDWPTLAGPHGDWTINEKGLASDWSKEGPKLLWENKEINGGFGSPVVAGGKVFVIDRKMDPALKGYQKGVPNCNEARYLPGPDVLKCLDRSTGKLIWQHEFNSLSNSSPTAWNTPSVEGDFVYARGGDGQVRCISVKDGKGIWSWPKAGEVPFSPTLDYKIKDLCSGEMTAASITICDDMLVVLAGHPSCHSRSIIVGLNKKTGAKVWEHIGSDWQFGANNYTVVTVGDKKGITAFWELLDVKTGEKLCNFEGPHGNMRFWARVGKGNLLYNNYKRSQDAKHNHGEGLLCNRFDVKPDGKVECTQLWKWKTPITDEQAQTEKLEKSFGGPLLVDGYLYVFMSAKANGINGSTLECVDAATGKDAWPSRVLNVPTGYASPICADGKIYHTDVSGTLFMFAADPKEYRPLGSAKVLYGGWSSPVISDGCLFQRGDAGGLKCLDLRRTGM